MIYITFSLTIFSKRSWKEIYKPTNLFSHKPQPCIRACKQDGRNYKESNLYKVTQTKNQK